MNLAQRTIHNAIFHALGCILPMALNLLILPYIIRQLGIDAYGILTLIMTVIGYFTLLDLGLGNAVIKFVAEYNGEGSQEKINDVIWTALLIFLILGLAGALVLLTIAKLLVTKVLKISPDLTSDAYMSFCIGSAGFFFTILLSLFSAIPNGLNRYDITSIVTISMSSTITLGNALLLYLGFGLIQIVTLNVLVSMFGVILYAHIAKQLLPTIRLTPVLKFSTIKKVISFGFFSLLSRVSYLVNYQVDRLIAGIILGVSWVTYYVVPFMLIMRITAITGRIAFVIFPAISELQGQKQYNTIEELYLTSSRVILAFATSICFPLFIFGSRFLSIWMGPDFAEKSGTVILLVTLGLYFNAFTYIPSIVVNGLGRPKISGTASVLTAALNLILMIPLATYMGINGIGLAFLISNVFITPGFILYVNTRVLRISTARLFKEAYIRPFLAGLLMLLPLSFVPQDQIHNLFFLMGMIIISSIGYFALSSLIGVFPQQERRVVFEYFRMVLGRTSI